MPFLPTIRVARQLPRARLPRPPQPRRIRFLSTARPTTPCPSCARPLPSNLPACTSCWSIRPLPPSITHHELFGLPAQPNPFDVDLPTLKRRFLEAQTSCHPDAWATKSSKDGDLAHTLSSRLNEAYQTLLQPLARAEYILAQHGYTLSESDQVEDMAFMMQIMEAREAIEDAAAENVHQIEELMERNKADVQHTLEEIRTLSGMEEWGKMKAKVIRLRYLNGIRKAGQQWLDNIGSK